MSHSLCRCVVHVVYSTKHRCPDLTAPFRYDLHRIMGAYLESISCHPLIVGGYDDHIHLLCELNKMLRPVDLVKKSKTSTTAWIRKNTKLHKFRWQAGYAFFAVSRSREQNCHRYIENQESHHQRVSFQDELRWLLNQHGIAYDERYLWD